MKSTYTPIPDSEEEKENSQSYFHVYFGLAVFISLFSFASIGSLPISRIPSTNFERTKGSGDQTSYFQFKRLNYDPLVMFTSDGAESLAKYSILNDYKTIIEPYAKMVLHVDDFSETSKNYFVYSVCSSSDDSKCQVGRLSNTVNDTTQLYIPCETYEDFTIKIIEYNPQGSAIRNLAGKGLCLYVRRELRTLTEADKTSALNAMYTMYSTTEEEGQALYGSLFHNSTYFVGAHHFNAAWRDGDHIHEGLGFLFQHLKMTNDFELAMQAVDPSVSLFYWDYTMDAEEGLNIFESPMFTPETFGSIDKPVDAHWGWTYRNDSIVTGAIKDGRWKRMKTDVNYRYPDLSGNYGYLRAPWSTNPSPYVSRFAGYTTTLAGCSDFSKWMDVSSFTDFLTYSPYQPHASTHGAIGSVYGCDVMDPLLADGMLESEETQLLLCQKWIFIMKELYRFNFISPSNNCTYSSLDYSGTNCPYECNPDRYDTMPIRLKDLIGSKYVGEISLEKWEKWREFVCSGDGAKIIVGDHVESASPADPSFWPIHPTLEKLVHAKHMSGGFQDTRWPSDAQNEYVCDKSQCYEGDEFGYFEDCCYGHFENDQLLDFVTGNKSQGVGLTNAEMFKISNPTSDEYQLNYIYDDFTWSHCTETIL